MLGGPTGGSWNWKLLLPNRGIQGLTIVTIWRFGGKLFVHFFFGWFVIWLDAIGSFSFGYCCCHIWLAQVVVLLGISEVLKPSEELGLPVAPLAATPQRYAAVGQQVDPMSRFTSNSGIPNFVWNMLMLHFFCRTIGITPKNQSVFQRIVF